MDASIANLCSFSLYAITCPIRRTVNEFLERGSEMDFWFTFIGSWAIIFLACYARGLYLELKTTKAKLEAAKDQLKKLNEELQKPYIERGEAENN